MRSINVLFGAAVLLSALVFSSVYIVDEREKVLVLPYSTFCIKSTRWRSKYWKWWTN